jgi:hypothetical protein
MGSSLFEPRHSLSSRRLPDIPAPVTDATADPDEGSKLISSSRYYECRSRHVHPA